MSGLTNPALLTCALIAAIEALTRYGILKIPNPPALALIAVIYAGYSGGLRAGLLNAALVVLYGLYFYPPPGDLLQLRGDDATRMVVLALVAPSLAWMTGALKDRAVRAVRAALDSEARYRTLSDLSSDWYWEQDENFRFVDLSSDATSAAGSSVGSHIGKTRWELPTVGVSEEDWAKHRAILQAHRPLRDFEFQRVNEAGETIWMSTSGAPIFDDAGRFKGYRGVARNITERKKAEEALRESEARFRGAFRLGLIGMALTSPEKGLIEVNEALCRMLGYSREQLVGTTWAQHTHPDDIAANGALLERALAGETDTYGMQKRLLRADGGIVHAEIAASCMRDPDGSARYFVLMVHDVTERKRLEERFRATVEAAPTAMVMIDAAGKIVLVNAETRAMFGRTREELIHQPVEILLPERFRGGHSRLREGFFASPQARRMGAGRDLFGLRKDGSEFPVEIGLNPIETAEGWFALSAIVDITERKRVELWLQDTLAQLSLRNKQLEALSTEDPLTGLWNRRFFDNALREECRRAHRQQTPISLLLVDADHFKAINDRYGHPVGDLVLQSLAKAIRDKPVRASDVAARFGGEEFVILLPDTDLPDALQVAETIRSRIAALAIETGEGAVAVTASIGVAGVVPRTPDDGSTILAAADGALYLAKASGRNRVQAADDALAISLDSAR